MSNEINQSDAKAHPVDTLVMLDCPFCGGNAEIEYEYTTSRHHSDHKDNYTVRCETPRCFGRSSVWKAYHEKEEAISRWNTRAI